MSNLWIIFAVTVLIAVYSAIEVFTNLNHKQQPRFKYFTIAFIVFIILAIIEVIFLAQWWMNLKSYSLPVKKSVLFNFFTGKL